MDLTEDPENTVEEATEKGDIATLLRILEDEGQSLTDLVPECHKLLIEALQRGYFDVASLLISKGAPVNCVSEAGWTPLHIAAGDPAAIEVVRMMLDRGADVNAEISVNSLTDFLSDEAGDSPLHRACLIGNLDIVKLLLRHGADVNKTNTHVTPPLIVAVKGKWVEITKILLENGADVHQHNINPPSLWCMTPLDWSMNQLFSLLGPDNLYKVVHHFLSWEPDDISEASKKIPTELTDLTKPQTESLIRILTIIELLVSKGASDNIIIQAMKFRYPDESFIVAKILIGHGAEMDVQDQRGISLMQVAACVGFYDLIKLFLENGAPVDRPNHCGWTPLMMSLAGFMEVDLDIIKLFIEFGADVNAEDDKGKTPLMIAIPGYVSSPSHSNIIEYLLDNGAHINVADLDGDTPLSRALRFRKREDNDDIIKLLLDRGAEVNTANSEGNTPLHIAISKYDRVGVNGIKMLLDHGAEINAKDAEGNTPLMLAISCCYISEIAQLLIDRGADVNTRNNAGLTPFQLAVIESRTDVLTQLLVNKVPFDPKELLEDETLVRLVLGTVVYRRKEVLELHQMAHRKDIKLARRHLVNVYLLERFAGKKPDFRGRAYLALYEKLRRSPAEIKCSTLWGSSALLFTLVESRLLELKLKREPVSCHHLKSVLSYRYTVTDDEKISYNNVCNKEIRRLKQFNISKDVNLYDVMSKDAVQCANYARNKEICRKLLEIYHVNNRYRDPVPFPIFHTVINDRIQNAVARKKLLEAGEHCLNALFFETINQENSQVPRDSDEQNDPAPKLPIVVSDAVLALLSDEDLQSMILADCGVRSATVKELQTQWSQNLATLMLSQSRSNCDDE